MIQVGINIISKEDILQKIKVEYLYHSLCNPKPAIEAKIRQLRIIRDLDAKQYAILKKQLPYVVCGIFHPPYRRTENFGYTEYFIIDIDHLSNKDISLLQIRTLLQKDMRVVLCFVSPSEDGLKLLFRLKERCYDAGLYSLFYKEFIRKFSLQYNLQQVIDGKTCDVTRACFISIDPAAYYNPDAEVIDMNEFINMESPEALFSMKHEQSLSEKQQPLPTVDKGHEPDKDTLDRIRVLLNPNGRKPKAERQVYVPEILDEIMSGLKSYIEQTGVVVASIVNIQYGKKMQLKTGIKQAEINLFYGKKGFSVVQSPRCGVSEELNELMAELIKNYLNNL